jgi:osmoprotectant transport system permease protein
VVDQLLGLIETGVARRRRGFQFAGMAGLAAVAALAFMTSPQRQNTAYVIGAKPFAEQYILAALIEQQLAAGGHGAKRREGLGSGVIFDALVQGDIDIYVEYSGTLWANQMKRTDVLPRKQVLDEVTRWAKDKYGVEVVGGLGFENAYTLAMDKRLADELGIRTVSDLSRHASRLSIAGDYEFFGRPEWKALRDAYGLTFRAQRQMQPEFMYAAAAARDVDVVAGYTSDGRMAQFNLVALTDDRQAIPPYDSIVLVSPRRAGDAVLLDAVKPLLNAINIDVMREANRRLGADAQATPESVARWLAAQIARR